MRQTFFAVLFTVWLPAGAAQAITLGQIDDFQDGTTQGWQEGMLSPNPPINLTDGGPAGSGDHALRNVSTGDFLPGGKMIQFNQEQWTGDYQAAGVDRVDVMLRADPSSAGPLFMRVAIQGSPFQRFSSNEAFLLPNDGDWYSASFLLADMVQVLGSQSLNEALTQVSEFRVLHNPQPDWIGADIVATLDMDNLTAAQVPEPCFGALALAALGWLWRFRVS